MNKELEEAIKKLDYYKTILIVVDETGTPNDLAQAIETVLKALDNSISKEELEKKKNQLLEEYKEVIKTNSIKAFIMKCQIEFIENLLEEVK